MGVVRPGAQVDEGAAGEVGEARVERIRRARQEDGDEPEAGVGGRDAAGGGEHLARPAGQLDAADQEEAGEGGRQVVGGIAAREVGLQALLGEAGGERPGHGLVAVVMADDDVRAGGPGGGGELTGAGEAVLGALRHGRADDLVELGRQSRHELGGARRGLEEVRRHRGVDPLRHERDPAGERMEQEAAEAVHVGAGVHRVAPDLLRRQVGGGAGAPAVAAGELGRDGDRQPEVGQRDALLAVRLGDHDVSGLDVTVHETVRVGGVEGVRDLGDDPHRRSHREAAAPVDQLLQGGAVDEAHRDVEAPVLLAAAVDGEDVGVLQRRGASRLGPEALAEALVLRDRRGDHLERDEPAQLDVDRAVHDSHATGARAPLDPVAGDHAAGRQQAEPGDVGLPEGENRPALVHGSVALAVGGDPRRRLFPGRRGGNRRRCGPRGAAHGRARCPRAAGGWSCPPTGCSCRAGR